MPLSCQNGTHRELGYGAGSTATLRQARELAARTRDRATSLLKRVSLSELSAHYRHNLGEPLVLRLKAPQVAQRFRPVLEPVAGVEVSA